jgi:hypothetical protein
MNDQGGVCARALVASTGRGGCSGGGHECLGTVSLPTATGYTERCGLWRVGVPWRGWVRKIGFNGPRGMLLEERTDFGGFVIPRKCNQTRMEIVPGRGIRQFSTDTHGGHPVPAGIARGSIT